MPCRPLGDSWLERPETLCGNKTEAGRRSWEILASLAATGSQHGEDFVAFLARHLTLAPQAGEARTRRGLIGSGRPRKSSRKTVQKNPRGAGG